MSCVGRAQRLSLIDLIVWPTLASFSFFSLSSCLFLYICFCSFPPVLFARRVCEEGAGERVKRETDRDFDVVLFPTNISLLCHLYMAIHVTYVHGLHLLVLYR